MEVCSGLPEYKIWLIGDSNPDCYKKIHYPLDKKNIQQGTIYGLQYWMKYRIIFIGVALTTEFILEDWMPISYI